MKSRYNTEINKQINNVLSLLTFIFATNSINIQLFTSRRELKESDGTNLQLCFPVNVLFKNILSLKNRKTQITQKRNQES